MVWQLGVHKKIVLSSDWAPKFDPSNNNVFFVVKNAKESTSLIGITQVGHSSFLQGLSSVSAAAAAAIAIDNESHWNAYKGNAASSSSLELFCSLP